MIGTQGAKSGRFVSLALAFAGMGATASVFPAVIPSFALATGDSVAAYLDGIPVLFAGLLAGVLLAAALGNLLGTATVLAVGAFLQCAGLVAVALDARVEIFVAAAAVAGFGFGLAEATGSVLARAVAGASTSGVLAALTGVVASVAAASPLILVLFLRDQGQVFVGGVSVIHLVGAVVTLANRASFEFDHVNRRPVEPMRPYLKRRITANSALILVAVSLFLYVGVETIFSGWSAVIPLQLFAVSADAAAVGTSIFWALMATGRFLAWLILRSRISPVLYLLINCASATVLLAVSAVTGANGGIISAVAVCAAVLCLGPCYSLILGIGLASLDLGVARQTTGFLVAAGAAGGAAVPALVVIAVAEPSGRLMIAVASVLMLVNVLIACIPRLVPRNPRPATPTTEVKGEINGASA